MHKVVIAGSVGSSFATLQSLLKHKMEVVAVFGYEPDSTENVSAYVNMREYCVEHKLTYFPFRKIADIDVVNKLKELAPDIFFVVGLSQLIPQEMLNIAKLGNIGFHPTLLPKGRGRAPIAWLILNEKEGAANFFLMGEGVDDGPIFVQEVFEVSENDTAETVEKKIIKSIELALDRWLPELKTGIWNPIPQDEMEASYYGKRNPEDGWINWGWSAEEIDKLIRASSKPHPGAFTFFNGKKIKIESCTRELVMNIKGVTGRVLIVDGLKYLIQTGSGLLWISDLFDEAGEPINLKVGQKLGYNIELELYSIRKEISILKENLKL